MDGHDDQEVSGRAGRYAGQPALQKRSSHLRHECSSYEQQLYKLFGKTGVNEAHDILQKRINEEIKRIYPQLKQ